MFHNLIQLFFYLSNLKNEIETDQGFVLIKSIIEILYDWVDFKVSLRIRY